MQYRALQLLAQKLSKFLSFVRVSKWKINGIKGGYHSSNRSEFFSCKIFFDLFGFSLSL